MDELPDERLSSQITFVYKLILPLFSLGLFVGPILLVMRDGFSWPLLQVALAWGIVLPGTFYFARLKRVIALPNGLKVSGVWRTEYVSYEDVDLARQYHQRNVTFVTLFLRRPCKFGSKIPFAADAQILGGARRELRILSERCPTLRVETPGLLRALCAFYFGRRPAR